MAEIGSRVMHIVLLKWADEASPEAIEQALAALRDMKGKIPGILDVTCGANFTDRAKGYTHGLVVQLENQAALDGYLPHPVHRAVVEQFINPIRADSLALDYAY